MLAGCSAWAADSATRGSPGVAARRAGRPPTATRRRRGSRRSRPDRRPAPARRCRVPSDRASSCTQRTATSPRSRACGSPTAPTVDRLAVPPPDGGSSRIALPERSRRDRSSWRSPRRARDHGRPPLRRAGRAAGGHRRAVRRDPHGDPDRARHGLPRRPDHHRRHTAAGARSPASGRPAGRRRRDREPVRRRPRCPGRRRTASRPRRAPRPGLQVDRVVLDGGRARGAVPAVRRRRR